MRRILLTLAAGFAGAGLTLIAPTPAIAAGCHPAYTKPCVPSDRGDLDCDDIKQPVTLAN